MISKAATKWVAIDIEKAFSLFFLFVCFCVTHVGIYRPYNQQFLFLELSTCSHTEVKICKQVINGAGFKDEKCYVENLLLTFEL